MNGLFNSKSVSITMICCLVAFGCKTNHQSRTVEKSIKSRDAFYPVSSNLGKHVGMRASSQFLGEDYRAEVTASDLSGSPKWYADSAPPLSTDNAELFARKWLEQNLGKDVSPQAYSLGVETWHLENIALKRWDQIDVWFYEVSMVPWIKFSYNYPSVTLFVRMDGKIIPPVKLKPQK